MGNRHQVDLKLILLLFPEVFIYFSKGYSVHSCGFESVTKRPHWFVFLMEVPANDRRKHATRPSSLYHKSGRKREKEKEIGIHNIFESTAPKT